MFSFVGFEFSIIFLSYFKTLRWSYELTSVVLGGKWLKFTELGRKISNNQGFSTFCSRHCDLYNGKTCCGSFFWKGFRIAVIRLARERSSMVASQTWPAFKTKRTIRPKKTNCPRFARFPAMMLNWMPANVRYSRFPARYERMPVNGPRVGPLTHTVYLSPHFVYPSVCSPCHMATSWFWCVQNENEVPKT